MPKKEKRKRVMDKKWKSLESRGLTRPKSAKENSRRAHEAHHGEGSYRGGQ